MTTLEKTRFERKKVSQWRVSHATGVSQSRISLYERGEGKLSDREKGLLAKFFSVGVNELFPEREGTNETM